MDDGAARPLSDAAGTMSVMADLVFPDDDSSVLAELKAQVRSARQRAARSVDTKLLQLGRLAGLAPLGIECLGGLD